jgi:lipopolysaccharide cholinephosphotransferase
MFKSIVNEETRSEHKILSNIKNVWSCELDLLKELLSVCAKYNLRCWIHAGTLLGAVRHKGFIPWDDDIDVVMFRDDYDILIHQAAKDFQAPYFLQTAYSDKNYIRSHAQLRNSNTTAILKRDIDQQFNQGIFIDIFVLDGVSKDTKIIRKQEKKILFYKRLLANIFYGKIENIKHIISRLLPKLIFTINRNYIKIFKKFENELRKIQIDSVDYVSKIGYYGIKNCLDKHWYDNTIYLDFENIKLPAPADYHNVLCVLYGNDYMTPIHSPSDHGDVIFDTNRSFTIVLKELRNSV